MNITQEFVNNVNNVTDILKRVVTGDESWAYGYNIETKVPSLQCMSPGKETTKSTPSSIKVKALLTVFFACHGVYIRSSYHEVARY